MLLAIRCGNHVLLHRLDRVGIDRTAIVADASLVRRHHGAGCAGGAHQVRRGELWLAGFGVVFIHLLKEVVFQRMALDVACGRDVGES